MEKLTIISVLGPDDKKFIKRNIKLIRHLNKELDFKSYKLETRIKCADELIGKNSDIP